MPKVMELGGEAFGRQLDHQGRVLRNEISVLIKKKHYSP